MDGLPVILRPSSSLLLLMTILMMKMKIGKIAALRDPFSKENSKAFGTWPLLEDNSPSFLLMPTLKCMIILKVYNEICCPIFSLYYTLG